MRRLLASVACCLVLLSGSRAPVTTAQSDSAYELARLVNEFRATNGMPALAINSALMTAAQRQADWLAVNHIHSHQGEGGTMPQDRATAAGYRGRVNENVASGTLGYATLAWAVQGWAGSPGHRQTMLASNVHIGTGVAENDEESFYILVVGSPSGAAPEPPATVADVAEVPADVVEPPPVVVPIVIATPREDGSVVHVVREGQTAWAIAARYGVALDDLLAINHLGRNAILHPGDEIIVRLGEGQPPPPPPPLPVTHIVQSGETLWTIAATYGLTLDELLALNGLARGAIIREGDELRLHAPEPTPTPTPAPTLTVTPAPTAALTVTTAPTLAPTPTRTPTATAIVTALPSPSVEPSATATPTPMPLPHTRTQAENSDQAVIAIGIVLAVVGGIVAFAGIVMMVRRRGEP